MLLLLQMAGFELRHSKITKQWEILKYEIGDCCGRSAPITLCSNFTRLRTAFLQCINHDPSTRIPKLPAIPALCSHFQPFWQGKCASAELPHGRCFFFGIWFWCTRTVGSTESTGASKRGWRCWSSWAITGLDATLLQARLGMGGDMDGYGVERYDVLHKVGWVDVWRCSKSLYQLYHFYVSCPHGMCEWESSPFVFVLIW